ncbi:acetyl esterase/lipase [Chryseobacterium sp. SORGH_AS 447]|uniref:alpha/beta hydrolase n=1 Tax=Chryseobacterium sp. SORGH_AS_0447 TaxID=3041769 RepID=UPI00277EF834|nr:alpha/beta hydrolase [Chryseobacterium sp. SORGH_AS_0447]MDQ1163637.1 acetyl esterase/lipase [Chryseobacterium sp. SORGH_AS_0447]
MKKQAFIYISLFLLILSGCRQKTIELGKGISFKAEQNISYGKDTAQKMDLYIPDKNADSGNVFIIIHGGGWQGGRKSQLTSFTFDLMKKFPHTIFVNLEYRLASSTRFALPDQTDDIKTAMTYVEKKLKIKPKYILLGNSAGGHLSMLYAYHYDQEKKVKAVVNIVGPADLNDPGFKNYDDYAFLEKHLINPKLVDGKLSLMDFGNPVHWITPASAPTLSYYGTADHVVPVSQKKILDSVLTRNKVYHASYEFNGDHVGWERPPHASFLVGKIEDFLETVDKK